MMYWVPILCLSILLVSLCLWLWPRHKLDLQTKQINDELKKEISLLELKRDTITSQIWQYQEVQREQWAHKKEVYDNMTSSYRQEYLKLLEDSESEYDYSLQEKKEQLINVTARLESLKASMAVALEENKRIRQSKEQADFYRIQISDIDVQEIKKIREIEPYLRDTSPLNKVIWKSYYENPFNSMVGRVIGGETKTGIYKLTNTTNGLIYIGKSENIGNRWREHVKKGIGAEAPNRNKLYPAMLATGVENFTFEILEECPSEELDSKEAFWIDYFNSKVDGYNATVGNALKK